MKEDLIGKKFDYLTVLEQYDSKTFICQCECGNKFLANLDYLYKGKIKKSCGCQVTKHNLSSLYSLWKTFSIEEKAIWGVWEDFVTWSKQQGYCEAFSCHKKDRRFPYNKENLEFGLFINKKFFTIQQLKEKKYTYNEREKKFVTSKKLKSLIINEDEITKAFNKQKDKHKILSNKLFKKLQKEE